MTAPNENTPEAWARNANEPDDTEGHALFRNAEEGNTGEADDTEGHRHSLANADEPDDTEGHTKTR